MLLSFLLFDLFPSLYLVYPPVLLSLPSYSYRIRNTTDILATVTDRFIVRL